MTQSLTEWLQQHRLTVVAVDTARRRLRLKADGDICSDVACGDQTVVVSDEGTSGSLETLNPGDIVRLESAGARALRIVVARRAWDELPSPEF